LRIRPRPRSLAPRRPALHPPPVHPAGLRHRLTHRPRHARVPAPRPPRRLRRPQLPRLVPAHRQRARARRPAAARRRPPPRRQRAAQRARLARRRRARRRRRPRQPRQLAQLRARVRRRRMRVDGVEQRRQRLGRGELGGVRGGGALGGQLGEERREARAAGGGGGGGVVVGAGVGVGGAARGGGSGDAGGGSVEVDGGPVVGEGGGGGWEDVGSWGDREAVEVGHFFFLDAPKGLDVCERGESVEPWLLGGSLRAVGSASRGAPRCGSHLALLKCWWDRKLQVAVGRRHHI
ncbi:hypothetical protein BDY21DRAFT_400446, partial [Lineolata rhizophorae]